MLPHIPASAAHRVRLVNSFDELATTRFSGSVNALCWPRVLPGGFEEIVRLLAPGAGITAIDDDDLRRLPVSAAGRAAIDLLIADQEHLRELDLDPVLNGINGYEQDETAGPVATDVLSWHVDSAPVEADTWLCTYHGPSSEGLINEEALRRVDIPETRAALLRLYNGEDDGGFAEYLQDHCYDLHYLPAPGARPFIFGQGHLWRIATEYPGNPVLPCIHRAPLAPQGQLRLLLIS